jgi:hypothetical protein
MKIDQCDRLTGLAVILMLAICTQAVGQSSIVLEPSSCGAEESWRSLSSQVSTNIQFINRKPFRVKVYWIDFTGKRQHYFDLEPDEVRDQQTFVSHPWIVTEAGDNQPCINIFFPNEKPGIVIIN